jgi:hypothetical protein
MRLTALFAGAILVLAACSGAASLPTSAPTINLGSTRASASPGTAGSAVPSSAPSPSAAPSAAASPTATPAPTPTPAPTATPAPTPTPAPTAAALRTDPEAAFGALLDAGQLPANSEAGEITVAEEYEFEPYLANDGLRVVSQTWSGEQFSTVFHFIYQFPTEADAEAFLRDGTDALSETEIGLEEGTTDPLFEAILDEVRFYSGELEAFGITTQNFNYLMRLKNFVVKVFVGGADTEPTLAEEIAFFAAQNLNSINVPLDPNATPAPTVAPTPEPTATPAASASAGASGEEGDFPNADEAALLEHIPTDTRGSCARTDLFYREEIDSVSCEPAENLFVDYSSFGSVEDVRAAFDRDFERAEPTPTEDGQCDQGNLIVPYTVGDNEDPAGQVMCTVVTVSSGREFKVIEWTNESLGILGYLQSSTLEWDELIEFWSSKAGPIE